MTVPSKKLVSPMKAATKPERGGLVNLSGRIDLFDAALVHDRDTVAEAHGLALIMRDVNERNPDLVMDNIQFQKHVLAEFQVKCGKRLIKKQDLRAVDEGAGDGDALFLASADLGWIFVGMVGHFDQFEHAFDVFSDFGLGIVRHAKAERNVIPYRHVREKSVILEDGVNAPQVGREVGDISSVQINASGVRCFESAQHAQERGFAASARPKQREELALLYAEGRIIDGCQRAESLGHVFENEKIGYLAYPCFKTVQQQRCRRAETLRNAGGRVNEIFPHL